MNAYKRADQNNVTTEASETNGKKMFVSSLINHFHYAPITSSSTLGSVLPSLLSNVVSSAPT